MIQEPKRQKIIEMLDMGNIYDPKAVVVLMSNGAGLQGVAIGHDELDSTEKVDLVAYLMKRLDINLDDIEETTQLADETRFMLNKIARGRIY